MKKTLAIFCTLGFLGTFAYAAQQTPQGIPLQEVQCQMINKPSANGVLLNYYSASTGITRGSEFAQKVLPSFELTEDADGPSPDKIKHGAGSNPYWLVMESYIKFDQTGTYQLKADIAGRGYNDHFPRTIVRLNDIIISDELKTPQDYITSPEFHPTIDIKIPSPGWYHLAINVYEHLDLTYPLKLSIFLKQPGSATFAKIPASNLLYETPWITQPQ